VRLHWTGFGPARHTAALEQPIDHGRIDELDAMRGCLVANSLRIAPAAHLTRPARWVNLHRHLLLTADPWSGIGGEDSTPGLSGVVAR
jgi:L-Ala-D/L-Glu epimerase